MRELFVTQLVKEVLGPRNGISEEIADNPLNEYITGVLSPATHAADRDVDSEADIPLGETELYEDEESDIQTSSILSPALDPKSRPRSMGLSFELKSNVTRFHICITWARYLPKGKNLWERKARSFVATLATESAEPIWLDASGRCSRNQAEISVHGFVTKREKGIFHVTIYLVNQLTSDPDSTRHPGAECRVRRIPYNLGGSLMFFTEEGYH
jgi:hypothetical protein